MFIPNNFAMALIRSYFARVLASLVWAFLAFAPVGRAQTPQWIWLPSPKNAADAPTEVYFRKTIRTPPLLWNAKLTASADDSAEVFLNGISVARTESWDRPARGEVSMRLNQGENVVAVHARNAGGSAGLLLQLNLGGETNVVTDGSWLAHAAGEPGWSSLNFVASDWRPAAVLGPHGMEPWGDVFARPAATGPGALTVPQDFKVELLRSAAPGEGSWICMAFDAAGRLTVSPEGDQRPLLRMTFQDGQISQVEPIGAPIRYAMGLLYAYDSLYANARGPDGAGLYRLRDLNGNDQFDADEFRLLKRVEGGSEHGYHAVRLGPDGRIYLINGNGTKLPSGISPASPHQRYAQDVLSLNPDETTEAGASSAVQCHVLRTDADGVEWELWAGGMRNAYAFDFSPSGELFAFDSDMEWDWGVPWYRPIRILHLVSGGDYGWRDGARSWPEYYEDSLPPVVDAGIGSPTGVRFGTRSRFPQAYQRALFALDWSYGRVFAVHLQPAGASYEGRVETFLRGAPLNLTDFDFGPDGAMYFLTGGRGTQSGLYRVSYTGPASSAARAPEPAWSDAVGLRRRLESFHGRRDSSAIDLAWPNLANPDRFIRYAARLALEAQETSAWRDRALSETNHLAAATALLALARVGDRALQPDLIHAVLRQAQDLRSEEQELALVRILQVASSRHGKPGEDLRADLVARWSPRYPASSWRLNRELSRLLIFLDSPGVIDRTLDLLTAAPTQEEQFHYVAQLRNVRGGWTTSTRRRYFEWWLKPRQDLLRPARLERWFADVGRRYVDGAWIDRYLREFRGDAMATLASAERKELAGLLAIPFQRAQLVPSQTRPLVREWTLSDLLPDLDKLSANRALEKGRQAFVDAQCITCHRLGNDGGNIGPELTGAASKYDARSLLESIVAPSKVVSDQYQNLTVTLKNGDSFTGRIVRESAEALVLETNPLDGSRETINRDGVESIAPSSLSPMPDGLVNSLTRDEILDLLAYIRAGGNEAAGGGR